MRLTYRITISAVVALIALVLPVVVLAQASATDPAALVGQLVIAVQGHHWGVVIGLVLAAVTYALRTWVMPKWAFIQTDRGGAIFAIGVAVLGTLATELAAGVTAWTTILDALAAAMSSAGGYSLAKKIIAPAPPASTPSQPASPPATPPVKV